MSYAPPNYTQIPNVLLDEHMARMPESELRVVLAIARETFGWHRERRKLSLTQLQRMTGLSRQGVVNGIESGTERGVIERIKDGQGYVYGLIVSSTELVNQVDQRDPTSQLSRLVTSQPDRLALVNLVDQLPPTLKKDLNKDPKKDPIIHHTPPLISNDVSVVCGGGGGLSSLQINHRSQNGNTDNDDPRRGLALDLIAANLPAWNAPAAHVARCDDADLGYLLSWLWLIDAIRRSASDSPYSVDAYYGGQDVAEYKAALAGIKDLVAFIVSRTGGGANPRHQAATLTEADAAALDAAIRDYRATCAESEIV